MGLASICLKITARRAYNQTYRMIPLSTPLFSHWSIPLKMPSALHSVHSHATSLSTGVPMQRRVIVHLIKEKELRKKKAIVYLF
jgi:hypothetical protein